jgi:hypothetical protein
MNTPILISTPSQRNIMDTPAINIMLENILGASVNGASSVDKNSFLQSLSIVSTVFNEATQRLNSITNGDAGNQHSTDLSDLVLNEQKKEKLNASISVEDQNGNVKKFENLAPVPMESIEDNSSSFVSSSNNSQEASVNIGNKNENVMELRHRGLKRMPSSSLLAEQPPVKVVFYVVYYFKFL